MIVIALALITITSYSATAELTDNIYLHYRMESVTGNQMLDSSANNRHGTETGVATATGKIGNGYYFQQVADLATINASLTLTDHTICSWINTNTSNTYFLYSDNAGANTVMTLGLNNNVKVGWYDASFWRESTLDIDANVWYFICWRINNSGTLSVFVNGTKSSIGTNAFDFAGDGAGNTISRNNAADFAGYADELSIWTRVLNDSEIIELYNSGNGLAWENWTSESYSIAIENKWNDSQILTFNATVNGTTYGTTNGTIHTVYNTSAQEVLNITIWGTGLVNYSNTSVIASNDTTFKVWADVPTNLEIHLRNYGNTSDLGNTNTTYWNGSYTESNPILIPAYDLFGTNDNTTVNRSFNFSDLNDIYIDETNTNITFTRGQTLYYHSMSPGKLVIYFEMNGSGYKTEYCYANNIYNATCKNETNVTIVPSETSTGKILVSINDIDGNYTQFFEFINNENDIFEETMEIMHNVPDESLVIKVLDAQSSALTNANVTLYYSYGQVDNTTEMLLHSRRLTDSEGYATFLVDTTAIYGIKIQYPSKTEILEPISLDHTYSRASPLEFHMDRNATTTFHFTTAYLPKYFTNRSKSIRAIFVDIASSNVKYSTNYYSTKTQASKDFLGQMNITLISGTHFPVSGNTNITLYIYLDDELYNTYTIEYIEPDNIFQLPDDLDSDIFLIIGIIAIAVLAIMSYAVFNTPSLVKHVFFGGFMLLGLAIPAYFWIIFFGVAYYSYIFIKMVILKND